MRILLSLCAVCTLSVLLSACGTVEGAGQDIQSGGHAISHAARDAAN